MKTRLFLLFLIVLFKTNAQNGFDRHIVTNGSDGLDGATAIAAGDIDGDGFIDVISTSWEDKNISWYKNLDGNGTFTRPRVIENNLYSAFDLFLVDLDNDGDLDILVSSQRYSEDKIFWYENTDGLGNFGPKQQIYSHVQDNAGMVINVADIDNDGDIDILCATTGNNQSRWFENNNGVFTEHLIATYDYPPTLISADDVNGDGNLDLVVGSYNEHVLYFYQGDGLGNFGTGTIISDAVNQILKYEFVDIDNDGDMDVIGIFDNKVAWFENLDGNGTFGTRQVIQSQFGLQSLAVLDVDNDGDFDVVVANSNRDKIVWFENLDGQGGFGSSQDIDPLYEIPFKLITADMNGDGFEDVISVSLIDQSVDWFKNIAGSGNFGKRETVVGLTEGPWATDSGDIDGNGLKDIVCAVYEGDKIVWFKNLDNEGLFSSMNIISTQQDGCRFVKLVDVDLDGDLDILAVTNSTVKWYENDGEGNFEIVHVVEPDNLGLSAAYFVDINGDGLKDIITFSTNYGVFWYENLNGLGLFGEKNIVDGTSSSNSFYPIDIDSDGNVDIVIAESVSKIAWFKNDGQGNFGSENLLDTDLFYAYNVTGVDIDNDGDNDLVVADFNKIVWYENLDGLGNFGPQKIIDDQDVDADHMVFYDMDGDGNLDLIASIWTLQQVVWYSNTDGNGIFSERRVIGPGSLIYNVDDIDNDGDFDVISPLKNGNKITWFENNGSLGITQNTNLGNDFIIFPNPSANSIKIKSTHEIMELKFYNNLGQLILSTKDSSEIDISSLDSGLYFVKALDASGNLGIQKLIKE